MDNQSLLVPSIFTDRPDLVALNLFDIDKDISYTSFNITDKRIYKKIQNFVDTSRSSDGKSNLLNWKNLSEHINKNLDDEEREGLKKEDILSSSSITAKIDDKDTEFHFDYELSLVRENLRDYFKSLKEGVKIPVSDVTIKYFRSSYFLLKSSLPRNLTNNLSSENAELLMQYLSAIRYFKDSTTESFYLREGIDALKRVNKKITEILKKDGIKKSINFTTSWSISYYYTLPEVLQGNIRLWLEHYSTTFSLHSRLMWSKTEVGNYYTEQEYSNEQIFDLLETNINGEIELEEFGVCPAKQESKIRECLFQDIANSRAQEEIQQYCEKFLEERYIVATERILSRAIYCIRQQAQNDCLNEINSILRDIQNIRAFNIEAPKKKKSIIATDTLSEIQKISDQNYNKSITKINEYLEQELIENKKIIPNIIFQIFRFCNAFCNAFDDYTNKNNSSLKNYKMTDGFYEIYNLSEPVPVALIIYNRIRELLYHFKFRFGIFTEILDKNTQTNSLILRKIPINRGFVIQRYGISWEYDNGYHVRKELENVMPLFFINKEYSVNEDRLLHKIMKGIFADNNSKEKFYSKINKENEICKIYNVIYNNIIQKGGEALFFNDEVLDKYEKKQYKNSTLLQDVVESKKVKKSLEDNKSKVTKVTKLTKYNEIFNDFGTLYYLDKLGFEKNININKKSSQNRDNYIRLSLLIRAPQDLENISKKIAKDASHYKAIEKLILSIFQYFRKDFI